MPAMGAPALELMREEIETFIERGAQKRLGMSAVEMIRAYQGGGLKDPGFVADLLALAYLLPENDPLYPGDAARVPSR